MGQTQQYRSLAHLRPRYSPISLCRRCLRRPNPSSGIRYRLADAARRIRSMACRCIGSYWFCDRLCARTNPPQTPRTPKRFTAIRENRQNRRRFRHHWKRPQVLGQPRQIPRYRPFPRPPKYAQKGRRHRSGQTLPQPVFLHRQLHRLCRNRGCSIQRNRRFIEYLSGVGKTQFRTQRHRPWATQNRPRRRVPIPAKCRRRRQKVRPDRHGPAQLFQQQKDARHPRHPARP